LPPKKNPIKPSV